MKVVRRVLVAYAVLCLILPVACCGSVCADPPSWSAFQPASFDGMILTPTPCSGVLDYTLMLGAAPWITLPSGAFRVNWVQAFFLVGVDQQTDIVATNGSKVKDWLWESKSSPGSIAGWKGTGSERVHPGQSKDLGFGTLQIACGGVRSGMHVGYQVGDSEVTGWYSGDVHCAEPSGICFALCALTSLCALRRRSR